MTSNQLIHETSPYLLQHAHNPVHWYPWGEGAFKRAREEQKVVLISIGYSACHWCHVMERESFEDETVAQIMNEHFICIKVDREERPDVDKIYMEAVQLINGQGGWPLNCFALPNGQPFFGGTYFNKNQWQSLLQQIGTLFQENAQQFEEQAGRITQYLQHSAFQETASSAESFDAQVALNNIMIAADPQNGGFGKAPKFPMPVTLNYLLSAGTFFENADILEFAWITLDKMAMGGIYDHLGGGFARYSVDAFWFAPHFEKMLYDNAQLVALYSDAYKLTKNNHYKSIVEESIAFLNRDMLSDSGVYYSSLDADSEGEEGWYYTWTSDELQTLLNDSAFNTFFGITEKGNWENGRNILAQKLTLDELSKKLKQSSEQLEVHLEKQKELLLLKRSERTRPALDDKVLTSWNALAIIALTNAYKAFGDSNHLNNATRCMAFLLEHQKQSGNGLFRTFKNGSRIDGFLDDYAFVIQALISLYEATFDTNYLKEAQQLTSYVMKHFYHEKDKLFYYTANNGERLIARKTDLQDNVIPSAVGIMTKNLLQLARLFNHLDYEMIAKKLIEKMASTAMKHPRYYAHWAELNTFLKASRQVVITGPDAHQLRAELQIHFFPATLYAGSISDENNLPILENRVNVTKNAIYICQNKTCKLPVNTVDEALDILKGSHPN
jgi:uncharacterized protein YyaL (SSP411 family)